MKFIKKCPLFILLLSTGLLFTIIGIGGKNNVYAGQEYDPLTTPVLSVMFTALNDEIYPWQIMTGESAPAMAKGRGPENRTEALALKDESGKADGSAESGENPEEGLQAGNVEEPDAVKEHREGILDANMILNASKTLEQEAEEENENENERLQPLRESTYDEYVNHISADIYGDAGVIRAASFEFDTVDESYFDDALFIGDSRTVGLRDYTDMSEHADFYCETSLTVYKVLEEDFEGVGAVVDALKNKDYGKIYIMVGINELGRGTTEDFMEKYTEVVDTLHELEPEAKIFIQGIMRVSGEKDSTDAIFNNNNINARNNAIATLADNRQFFYIDVNEVVCDGEGNLNAEYTFDQIHLLGACNEMWKEFLLTHGVNDSGPSKAS